MKKQRVKSKLERFIEERLVIEPEKAVRIGVWAVGTVVCHNLNISGLVKWFGKQNERVDTGLPGPFRWRRKFPWETGTDPTLEDKICEWGIPALASYALVYHPEAIAKFIDAMIPF